MTVTQKIHSLQESCDWWVEQANIAHRRAVTAEAKLAKIEEALGLIDEFIIIAKAEVRT
jgi:hypothetical protein